VCYNLIEKEIFIFVVKEAGERIMKRILFWIMTMLAIVPLLSLSPYPAAHGILLVDSNIDIKHTMPHDILRKMIIVPETNFSHHEAKKMIDTLAHIDPSILQKAADHHIYIQLLTGKITDEPSARHLHGKTPRGYLSSSTTWDDVPGLGGSHLVLVKIGHSEKGKGHGSVNLELHEFAHSIDYIVFDHIHETAAFRSIWQEEAAKLFPHHYYFLTYPEEYFAESFAYYYYSDETRKHLQIAAPKTYQFIRYLAERARL
jgi:Pro-Pro endopeptidase